jgi:hypothetical protein
VGITVKEINDFPGNPKTFVRMSQPPKCPLPGVHQPKQGASLLLGKPSGEADGFVRDDKIACPCLDLLAPAPKFTTNMSLTFSSITKHPKTLTTNDLYFVPYFGAT